MQVSTTPNARPDPRGHVAHIECIAARLYALVAHLQIAELKSPAKAAAVARLELLTMPHQATELETIIACAECFLHVGRALAELARGICIIEPAIAAELQHLRLCCTNASVAMLLGVRSVALVLS